MTSQVYLDKVWALSGGVTPITPARYEDTGWVTEIPTYQNFNHVLQITTKNLLVMAEQAAWQWQTEISYAVGATVWDSGLRYYCITANSAQNPLLDTNENYWTKAPVYGNITTPIKAQGMTLHEINVRASGTVWSSSDFTIENTSALIQLNTSNVGQKNWLLGNVQGELVAVDTGLVKIADNKAIAPGSAETYRLFHEGHLPNVAEVVNAVPEAPADGKMYARVDNAWTVVTTTIMQEEPAPDVAGLGTGWYNLTDGKYYLDIDDGDTSQWVPANPPQLPVSLASDVEFDNSGTGLSATNVQAALAELAS